MQAASMQSAACSMQHAGCIMHHSLASREMWKA
jgi:hypothetical protein